MIVAFDVDGTLINFDNTPKYEVIETLKFFAGTVGTTVYVWSGGGNEWAENWVQKLGLENYVDGVIRKGSQEVDIAFDDEFVKLGKVNIKIKTNGH